MRPRDRIQPWHDRVRLTAHERAVLDDLERELAEGATAGGAPSDRADAVWLADVPWWSIAVTAVIGVGALLLAATVSLVFVPAAVAALVTAGAAAVARLARLGGSR